MRRYGIILGALAAAPLPASVSADANAIGWLLSGATPDARVIEAGDWAEKGGEVLAIDPLTLFGAQAVPISVPARSARVVGILENDAFDPRVAFLVLVWSDAPVVCGEDLATIGVDTGLAGFAAPADIDALNAYADDHAGDLYDGPYAEQIDTLYPGPFLATLPDGTAFPLSGSGYGDGGYPVASLYDADGAMVALYAQFITNGDEWHLPPLCAPDNTS